MAWGRVELMPGVNVEQTPTLNRAGYVASSLVRFMSGLAQKIGGWSAYVSFAIGGRPRDMKAWQDFNDRKYLAIGSTTTLGVVDNADRTVLLDITPTTYETNLTYQFSSTIGLSTIGIIDPSLTAPVTTYDSVLVATPFSVGGIIVSGMYAITRITGANSYEIETDQIATSTVVNAGSPTYFSTTTGSNLVVVDLLAHGMAVGSTVVFQTPITIGGITISGSYQVLTVASANQFTIGASSAATSAAGPTYLNGGYARLIYYIALGPAPAGSGYSLGTYSGGGYSLGSASGAQTGTPITSTDWTFDNWGSTLIACSENGGIYQWAPNSGFQNAKLIADAPTYAGGIFIAAPAQILLAWGSSAKQGIGIDQDPLAYSWSDQGDYEFWTPGVQNPSTGNFSQAGTSRIPTGSRIVAGLQGPQQALLWTDLDLWAVNYLGSPERGLTFGQNKIGSSCGAVGSHSVGQLGNGIFWMGQSNFFALTGQGVTRMPCTVWDAVFQNLDTANAWKVRACPNTPFQEMTWMYPSISGGSGENDSYVSINMDGQWVIGPLNTMPRSAWIDQSVIGNPIGADPSGNIYLQETTNNANGLPINYSYTTGYWTIAEGEEVAFVDMIIPDFKYGTYSGTQAATIQVTVLSVMYPGGPVTTYGPYSVTNSTTYFMTRVRGRQMALQFSGADLNSFTRLGLVRYRFAPDGRF